MSHEKKPGMVNVPGSSLSAKEITQVSKISNQPAKDVKAIINALEGIKKAYIGLDHLSKNSGLSVDQVKTIMWAVDVVHHSILRYSQEQSKQYTPQWHCSTEEGTGNPGPLIESKGKISKKLR